jgi:glycosyltransferase involved in cell wall biosynthesis
MNILLINTGYSHGGAARITRDIKTNLEKRGHLAYVLNAFEENTKDHVFQIRPSRKNKIGYYMSNDIEYADTNYIIELDIFKKADIVHCHNLHGWYFNMNTLQKMSEIKPVLWTLHDMWAITSHCAYTFETYKKNNGFYECPSRDIYPRIFWPNERHLRAAKKKIYEKTRMDISVPSKWLQKLVEGSVLRGKNTNLIYNGVDNETFIPTEKNQARKKLKLPHDKKIILFVADGGKDNVFKGWQYCEAAINKLKDRDFLVLIIGGDQTRVEGNFHFIKRFTDKTILSLYYSACDVYVFTSLSENFPLVILEALSCECCIVSFDVGGVNEAIIHKQNGYLAKYKSIDDVYNGINYFFSLSEEDTKQIRKNARVTAVSKFSLTDMIDGYENLYRNILMRNMYPTDQNQM